MEELKIESAYRVGERTFNTYDEALECLLSIKKIPEMYAYNDGNDEFERVYYKERIGDVVVINIGSKEDISWFIEANDAENCNTDGIDENVEFGWYAYDNEYCVFSQVPDKETAFKLYRGSF